MSHQERVSTHYDQRAASQGRDPRAAEYHSGSSLLQRQRVVLRWLRAFRDKRILDVGCGHGLQSEPLARHHFLIGLDLSPKMLELAKNHLRPVQGEAEILPFQNESFDIILAIETLQHIPQPEVFLKEVDRTLRPGGDLVLSTLNPSSLAQRIARRFSSFPDFYCYHPFQKISSLLGERDWICLERRFLGYPLPWSWPMRSRSGPFSFLANAWIARFQKKNTMERPSQ